MGEHYGYSKTEEARLNEFGKRADAMDEASRKIEEGEDTSAAQLDRYLAAASEFYRWSAHNPHPDHPSEERENSAQWHWRYSQILSGSYHREKANYALEQALLEKQHTDNRDEYLQRDDTEESVRVSFTAQNEISRVRAANWFRTAANCLLMPEEQGRPSALGQHEPTPDSIR